MSRASQRKQQPMACARLARMRGGLMQRLRGARGGLLLLVMALSALLAGAVLSIAEQVSMHRRAVVLAQANLEAWHAAQAALMWCEGKQAEFASAPTQPYASLGETTWMSTPAPLFTPGTPGFHRLGIPLLAGARPSECLIRRVLPRSTLSGAPSGPPAPRDLVLITARGFGSGGESVFWLQSLLGRTVNGPWRAWRPLVRHELSAP